MYEIKTILRYNRVKFDETVNEQLLNGWKMFGDTTYLHDGDEDSSQSIVFIQQMRRSITE